MLPSTLDVIMSESKSEINSSGTYEPGGYVQLANSPHPLSRSAKRSPMIMIKIMTIVLDRLKKQKLLGLKW